MHDQNPTSDSSQNSPQSANSNANNTQPENDNNNNMYSSNMAIQNAMMMMQQCGQLYSQQQQQQQQQQYLGGNMDSSTADEQQEGIFEQHNGNDGEGGDRDHMEGDDGNDDEKQQKLQQQQQQILQQIQQQQQQQQAMNFIGAFNPYLYYSQYQGAMQAGNSSSNPSASAVGAASGTGIPSTTANDQNNFMQAYLAAASGAAGRMNTMPMAQSAYPFLGFGYPGFAGMNAAASGMATMSPGNASASGSDTLKRKSTEDEDSEQSGDDSSDDDDGNSNDGDKKRAKRTSGAKTYYCEKCKREYRSESIYLKHCMFSRMHDTDNVKNWPTCEECGQRYYPTNQEQHLQQCRKKRALGMPVEPSKPKNPIKHFCKKCDKGFRSKSGFVQHMKFDLRHDPENINNWQYCKRCNKRLPPSRMYYHNKVCKQKQDEQQQHQEMQMQYAMQLPAYASNTHGAAILSSVAGKNVVDTTEAGTNGQLSTAHTDGHQTENNTQPSSSVEMGDDVERFMSMIDAHESSHLSGEEQKQ